jgi:uncharacterized protein (DUF58 family)
MDAAPAPTPAAPDASLARLRRIEWSVRNAVQSMMTGEYLSVFRGRGMEFDQVAKYNFGDDIRDVDWKVTARLGEPYRKVFVEERDITVILVFEDTPSLQFGSRGTTRRQALLDVAELILLIAAVCRDRVGFVHATPSAHVYRPPAGGSGRILRAAASLRALPPPDPVAAPAPAAIPWALLEGCAPRNSILVWCGDFAPRPFPPAWAGLQQRYQTIGVRIDDPWDLAFPAGQRFAAYDPASGRVDPFEDSPTARAAHAAWCAAREEGWRRLFPDPFGRLAVGTGDDLLAAVVRFFHARRRALG